MLYGQARASRDDEACPRPATGTTRRTPNEEVAWDSAVAYYAANYVDKDLLFSTELILLKISWAISNSVMNYPARKQKHATRVCRRS